MAYVGINDRFMHEVARHINRIRDEEIEKRCTQEQIKLRGLEDWLTEKSWLGHYNLKELMPDNWIRKHNRFDIYFFVDTTDNSVAALQSRRANSSVSTNNVVSCSVELDKEIPVPPYTDYSYHRPDLYVPLTPDEQLPDEIRAYIDASSLRTEIRQRWNDVVKTVKNFLDNCKSLNEALKLWPQLRTYIPSEYLERVDKKSSKAQAEESKAAEFLKSIDTGSIQASAVMARLSGVNLNS